MHDPTALRLVLYVLRSAASPLEAPPCRCARECGGSETVGLYKYGNHLTPGLTKVRSYAAFFTSFPAEGLRVRFRAIPALKTA